MRPSLNILRLALGLALACGSSPAQAVLAGRVVDETGAGVPGARVELRQAGKVISVASSDPAGRFSVTLPAGVYDMRAERQGFYLYQGAGHTFGEGQKQITIVLNHQQEYYQHVDVSASPPDIDPEETSAHKEIDSRQAQTVPYPAPQDFRNALPLANGVVQDNGGRVHVNGAGTNQTSYTLDGFNIADPVSGRLDTRVNIETIQSMNLDASRFSADTGGGSAGALELVTKMGDDHWRFGGTNFIPGISFTEGLHVSKWTPRVEVSGPIARGRAWFHNGFDAFYNMDIVHGLPSGQNQIRGLNASDLARVQVNLTRANILTVGELVNLTAARGSGLSIFNPLEATQTDNRLLFMSSIRDQHYFGGALLDVGFADTRGEIRLQPRGSRLYQITPFGNRGNYFEGTDQHAYRQQWTANLFFPTLRLGGEHQFKLGTDFQREAFHSTVTRRPYEVIRDDNSLARVVTFEGAPYLERKNFTSAQFIQDRWRPREELTFEAGIRAEWNEVVRRLDLAPRLSAVWAPRRFGETKFSAGWGVYCDVINLAVLANQQAQTSTATFYSPGGTAFGPVSTVFQVNDRTLVTPRYRTVSAGVERRLPRVYFLTVDYSHRRGGHGLAFIPMNTLAAAAPGGRVVYDLQNARHDRYDGVDVSIRHTFAGQYEWFAGYTRSSSRTSAAVDYSPNNPIFADQAPGPYPWDTPNRFHVWGWLPLPDRRMPARLRFATRNTTAALLLEYRTGFPFSVNDEQGFQVGPPGSMRFPDYFNVNLHLERRFQALHHLWAWRFGLNNLTNNGNPNAVNNVIGTPYYLTYGRGQARAFAVRLRMLGKK